MNNDLFSFTETVGPINDDHAADIKVRGRPAEKDNRDAPHLKKTIPLTSSEGKGSPEYCRDVSSILA